MEKCVVPSQPEVWKISILKIKVQGLFTVVCGCVRVQKDENWLALVPAESVGAVSPSQL